MKTKITLTSSSMLFFNTVNLFRGVPVEVDSDILPVEDIRILNNYIRSGAILSSNGELEIVDVVQEEVEPQEQEVIKIPETPEQVEDIKTEVEVVKEAVEEPTVEEKPATTRKTPVRKTAASKTAAKK